MRKHVSKLLAMLGALGALCLSSCGGEESSSSSYSPAKESSSSSEPTRSEEPSSSAEPVHEHTFDNSVWEYDSEHHWHPSSCGHNVTSTPVSHTFSKEVTEATYSDGGYTTYTCSVCKYSYRGDETPKLKHTYSENWSSDASSHWHACLDEGYTSLRADESSHDFQKDVTEATYASGGYSTYTCKVCGYSYTSEETPKLEHHYSSEWSNDPTSHWHACTDEGYSSLRSDESSHDYEAEVVEATYESEGYTVYTCKTCGYSYRADGTDELEHNYSNEWSSNSSSHWHACLDEGYPSLKSDEGEHDFASSVTEATYSEGGYTTYTCKVCGYSYRGDETPTLKHSYSSEWSSDSNSHWHACLDEGYSSLRSGESDHSYRAEVTEPTYSGEGYTIYTCSVCGYSYKGDVTGKLEHNYSDEWSSDSASHWHSCTDEGYASLRSSEAPHNFVDTVVDPTYSEGGYTTHVCSVCGYGYSDGETSKLEHSYSDSWSSDSSGHWHACTDAGYSSLRGSEAPHSYNVEVTEPTYESGGYSVYTCMVCGYSYRGSETPKLEHAYTLIFDLNGGTSNSYVASKGVESLSVTDFFFDCRKTGYNFRGWSYNGIKVFDEYGNMVFSPTMEKQMTFVAVFANDARISIKTNMSEAGSVSGSGYYEYNTDVDVLAIPYQGYDFVGWYDSDGLPISSSASYKYRMADKDIEIEARFKLASFSLSISSNNSSLGVVFINPTSSTPLSDYSESAGETITYTHDVKVIASTKSDVRFLGWFDKDSNLVSNSAVYSFSMPNHDYVLEAKWNRFAVSYDANGGTNSSLNPSYVSNDEEAALYSPTRAGYDFKGWYDKKSGALVENIAVGTLDDIDLVAKWEPIQYAIHYVLGSNGVNASSNPDCYTIEQNVMLDDPSRPGYDFVGWYSDSSYSSSCSSIALGSMGERTFYAKWSAISYSITYDLGGGTNDSTNPETFTVEDDVPLSDPSREGYDFKGWYLDSSYETKADSIPVGTTGNLSLRAKWEAAKHSLSVTSEDDSKGTVSVSGDGYTDETITVTATSAEDCVFKGWYSNEVLMSTENPYTFTMPSNDLALEARFMTKEEVRRKALGIDPVIDSESNTLTYGLYPQKRVSDSSTLASLNALTSAESNGWYLLNGEYYAKKEADPYSSSYVFDDGTTIVSGTTYWFKCEPITWKILSSESGEYSLVSTVLLDAHRYNEYYSGADENGYYANNYENSEIREWLNGDFYDSAFSLGDSLIQTTAVDNSASTTDSSSNVYACANTEDKVYLLSYKDYLNADYGFSTSSSAYDAARRCKTTDWARANGAWYSTSSSYLYNGYYWTRSPYSSRSNYARLVGGDGGYLGDYYVSNSNLSVRPSLRIKVAQ